MAKIKIKNSVTAGSAPSGLSFGEIAVNITDKKIFIGNAVEGVVTLHDQQNVVTSINGSTGAVSNIAVTNAAQTFSGLQTFSTGVSAATIYAATIGGDEGGQVDFGNPTTNTSLTGGVAIDIYQNKMRFFEKGGSARGYYIDLSAGGAGVGTDLVGGGGAVTSVSGSGNGILVSPTTGAVVVSNTGVHSVNGFTGAVQAVSSVNGETGSIIGVATYTGTTPFSALQQFNQGISATSGSTFSAATVYISNSTANIDPLFIQHSTTGALKVATTGQARSGSIRLGNAATSTQNTFISQTDGTLTLYNGLSTTGSNMISISTSAINIPTTISGATFSGLIRSSSGISASAAITGGSYIVAESGFRVGSSSINAQTDSYSLQSTDNGKIITVNAGTSKTITVPSGLPVGFNCTVIRLGSGAVSFSASGTTINSVSSFVSIASQHGAASLISYTTDVFNLSGNLA